MDDVTINKIDQAITEAEDQKRAAARKVRRLKRIRLNAGDLDKVLAGEDLEVPPRGRRKVAA